ncbi:DUF742 domain-containing protein [Peterkaempfera bronchialis]|uniref:DUF742 domain-containing protein n=1 Tax=Peterkaempfera bronchialis TaxID=2126346 RepID=A0A345T3I3_9ACTN|nr:DUF742 domain-containing protein [Peterkaempfera bronchialis]AXI80538.1 DUF742 domain-containing protein [Peterkaempfera bronchialis]
MAGPFEQAQPDPASGHDVASPGSWDLQWYDDDAGPVVRPYAMTRGRTRPTGDSFFDLVSVVSTVDRAEEPDPEAERGPVLDPEHHAILEMCRCEPLTVAEIGSATGLPVGVVRVLLGDLDETGRIRVTRPVPPAQLPDERILREVINGLRAL